MAVHLLKPLCYKPEHFMAMCRVANVTSCILGGCKADSLNATLHNAILAVPPTGAGLVAFKDQRRLNLVELLQQTAILWGRKAKLGQALAPMVFQTGFKPQGKQISIQLGKINLPSRNSSALWLCTELQSSSVLLLARCCSKMPAGKAKVPS